jgi:hypothetical protein
MTHCLLISPAGLLEVLHSNDDLPIDPREWLEAHEDGAYVALNITVGGREGGQVHFVSDPTGVLNPRARDALARLTGVHVVLTGTVAFTGLEPARVAELVQAVG